MSQRHSVDRELDLWELPHSVTGFSTDRHRSTVGCVEPRRRIGSLERTPHVRESDHCTHTTDGSPGSKQYVFDISKCRIRRVCALQRGFERPRMSIQAHPFVSHQLILTIQGVLSVGRAGRKILEKFYVHSV